MGCVLVKRFISAPVFCAGAWSARYNNTNSQDQWIQADLGTTHRIESVTTQGRPSSVFVQWVTSYYISYSLDGANWVDIPTLYSGNVDQYTKKTNNLPPNMVARYVRLRPQAYREHISLRFDVTGCPVQSKASSNKRVTVVRHITNPPPPPPSHFPPSATAKQPKLPG